MKRVPLASLAAKFLSEVVRARAAATEESPEASRVHSKARLAPARNRELDDEKKRKSVSLSLQRSDYIFQASVTDVDCTRTGSLL